MFTTTYYDGDGNEVGRETDELLAREHVLLQAHADDAVSAKIEGGGRVAGYATFVSNDTAAGTVPAVSRPFNMLNIPHVVSDENWWTGLAFFNTADDEATVVLTAETGAEYGFSLPSHGHRAFSLEGLGADFRSAGNIAVSADRNIAAVEIIGQRGPNGDIAALAIDNGREGSLFLPRVGDGNGIFTSVAIQNLHFADEVVLRGEKTSTTGAPSISSDLGVVSPGHTSGYDIQDIFGAEDGWLNISSSYENSMFGESRELLAGMALFWENSWFDGYLLTGRDFKKGVLGVNSSADHIVLLNPADEAVTVTYAAYGDSGEVISSGAFGIEASSRFTSTVSDFVGSGAESVSSIVLSCTDDLYGHVKSIRKSSVTVLPAMGY